MAEERYSRDFQLKHAKSRFPIGTHVQTILDNIGPPNVLMEKSFDPDGLPRFRYYYWEFTGEHAGFFSSGNRRLERFQVTFVIKDLKVSSIVC